MASSYRHPPGFRRDDPDETEGRLLYRHLADAEAGRQIAMTRKVRLAPSDGAPLRVKTGSVRRPQPAKLSLNSAPNRYP